MLRDLWAWCKIATSTDPILTVNSMLKAQIIAFVDLVLTGRLEDLERFTYSTISVVNVE